MTIDITDVNDNTPVISDDSTTIPEDTAINTTVITFSGSDADGDSLTYSIVGGNIGGAFAVSGDTLIVS
jgi:hypothetical protein